MRNDASEQVQYLAPDVEIFEDEQALVVSADVPGVAPGNAEVEFEGGYLTVTGRVANESNGAQAESKVQRAYRRRFTLADASRFDTEHISAVLRHGVLELRLPKAEKAKRRQIPVTVN